MKNLILFLITLTLLYTANAQNVGIGTNSPNSSAKLHISSSNSGLLIPNIALSNATLSTPITSPAVGLLVWNTNAAIANGNGAGYYYWDGAIWVRLTTGANSSTAENGLFVNGATSSIRMGAPLLQNTTIDQGAFGMTYNLTGGGDFLIQDNGIDHFSVLDNGNSNFGGDVNWRDENTTGIVLAQIIDEGNDGRFIIRENGVISVDLNANTEFIFNEQGLDRNFRIESDGNENVLFVDASTDRVGLGTLTPVNTLDVNGKLSITKSTGDEMVIINNNIWNHNEGDQEFGEGGAYFIIASKEGADESAGIYGDGDHVTIWSSGDGAPGQPEALLYINNEDGYDASDTDPFNNNALVAYLDPSGNWVTASDKNRKENIVGLKGSLNKLLKINGYSYSFKLAKEEIKKGDQKTKTYGVIAQEVVSIFPEIVDIAKDGSHYVSYTEFIPVLIESIKEQQNLINYQNEKTENQQKEFNELKAELTKISSTTINAVMKQRKMIKQLQKEIELLKEVK